jgi:hypothetical protein
MLYGNCKFFAIRFFVSFRIFWRFLIKLLFGRIAWCFFRNRFLPVIYRFSGTLVCLIFRDFVNNITNTMKTLYHYKKIMVQMLNPVHSLKSLFNVEEAEISGWVHFWDYFYKIVLSYFIFQTISAFRKYSKV